MAVAQLKGNVANLNKEIRRICNDCKDGDAAKITQAPILVAKDRLLPAT